MTFTTRLLATALTTALLTSPAFAQTHDHSGHDMSQMDHSKMNPTDMKSSDMQHHKMDDGSMDHGAVMAARSEHMIEAMGVVKKVYKKDGMVSLSHDAIPSISWPAMTMKFPVGGSVDLNSLKKGQKVQFTLHRAQDGSLPLVELCATTSVDVIAGLCAPGMNHGPDRPMMNHSDMKHGGMSHEGMKH